MSTPKRRRQFSAEKLLELEEAMHNGPFDRWGGSHEKSPGSGIKLLPYDPVRYPEQRIDHYVTEAQIPFEQYGLPDKLMMFGLRELGLAKALGRRALARQLVADFKPAAEQVADMLDRGRNVALIPAHKHYADIGIGVAGLAVAMGKTRYIKENIWQSINKLMTREEYHGQYIPGFARKTGKVLWVIPDDGAKKWGVPDRARLIVGRGAMGELQPALENDRRGVLMAVALTGGAMDPVLDSEDKVVSWKFRDIPPPVSATLSSYHAALPFAYDKDKNNVPVWEVGDLILPPETDPAASGAEVGRVFTDNVYLDLAQRMERLTGLPVEYQPLAKAAYSGVLSVRESISLGNYPE